VKKVISILFLTVYLFSATQVSELFKLPELFQHYIEHKAENHSLSFFTFLDLHYLHSSPKDADYTRDMQLPFKTCIHPPLALAVFIMPVPPVHILENIFRYEKKQKLFPGISGYTYHYACSIWQPPRNCQSPFFC
jgi:hypothetical protein